MDYEAKLLNHRFRFFVPSAASPHPGKVELTIIGPKDSQWMRVDYRDLREFARAAMDATTDALVAAAVAEGKVPS